MSFLLHPEAWRPLQFHDLGTDVRAALEEGTPQETARVLSLAPLIPLEAGLETYPAFATGPFAWRTAGYLAADARSALGIVSDEELDLYLAGSPPDGILVGFEPGREVAFVRYAVQHGYREIEISPDYQLWVKPAQDPP
jgi:hypothetical protein